MFKKEYIYELIENIYQDKTKRNLAVSKLIGRLEASGNLEMSNVIKNIQEQNTFVSKSTIKKPSKIFSNYTEKLCTDIGILKSGYKHSIIKSAILYGKPGTGKTYFVDKLGKNMKLQVVRLNLSNILDYRYGESIKKLENFINLNRNKSQIIFFDEADSLFTKRGQKNDVFETSRMITTMLQLLDMEREALVIISTNLIETIDKAIIRRFDLMLSFDHVIKDKKKVLDENLETMGVQLSNDESNEVLKIFNNNNIDPTFSDLRIVSKRIAIAKLERVSKKEYKKMLEASINDLLISKTREMRIS